MSIEELYFLERSGTFYTRTLILPNEIHQLEKLKKLHIEGSILTVESVKNICQLKNLEELVIDEATRDNMPSEISMLPKSVKLKVFTSQKLLTIEPNMY